MSTSCITTIAQQRGYMSCCLVMVRWSLLTFDQLYVFLISWLWDYSIWNNQYLGYLFTFLAFTGYERFLHSKDGTKTAGIHLSISPETRWLLDSTHLTNGVRTAMNWEIFSPQVIEPIYKDQKSIPHALLQYWFHFFFEFSALFFLGAMIQLWRYNIFQMGWFNHQLDWRSNFDMRVRCCVS